MNILKRFLPTVGVLILILLQFALPDSELHPSAKHNYYSILLFVLLGITILIGVISFFNKKLEKYFLTKGHFWLGVTLVIFLIDLFLVKLALLPVIFFPSFDRVIAVFIESYPILLKCIFFSFRLLILGIIFGTGVGFLTGVALGFSKRFYFWVNPFIKFIGPIPATAWIPFVLTIFPTPFGASVFIIALAVWFPVQLMTSSGIQNTTKTYFEVGRTLGAKDVFQILRIGIPSALPNIFQGVFNGICAAFIALMTAEMFGAKYGIGWYISWQKGMMEYSGVYAGLIMIAVFCSIVITLLFKLRKHFLSWQKGLIKW